MGCYNMMFLLPYKQLRRLLLYSVNAKYTSLKYNAYLGLNTAVWTRLGLLRFYLHVVLVGLSI